MSDPQGTGTGTNDAGEPQKTADGQQPDATGNGAPGAVANAAADGKPAEGSQPAAGKDGKSDAAVDYKFDAPEGVTLDKKSVDAFTAIAKELKLPAEAAKKIADVAIQAEVGRAEAFKVQVAEWATQVSKDAELSKPEVQATARKAVETFGSPELKALLNSTGMGNHPEVVRLMAKVGAAISEDKLLGKGDSGQPSTKSAAQVLYGTP